MCKGQTTAATAAPLSRNRRAIWPSPQATAVQPRLLAHRRALPSAAAALPEMTPMQLNIVLSVFLNDQKIDPVSNYLTSMYMYNVLGCVFSNLSCKRNALGLSN